MSRLEKTMAALQKDKKKGGVYMPEWDLRQRLALALMRGDRQVKCGNCRRRYGPCSVYKECKETAVSFKFFLPRESLMETQMRRVESLMAEIGNLV